MSPMSRSPTLPSHCTVKTCAQTLAKGLAEGEITLPDTVFILNVNDVSFCADPGWVPGQLQVQFDGACPALHPTGSGPCQPLTALYCPHHAWVMRWWPRLATTAAQCSSAQLSSTFACWKNPSRPWCPCVMLSKLFSINNNLAAHACLRRHGGCYSALWSIDFEAVVRPRVDLDTCTAQPTKGHRLPSTPAHKSGRTIPDVNMSWRICTKQSRTSAEHAAGGPVLGTDSKHLCPVPMLTLFKERGERGLMVPEFQPGTLLSNDEDFPVQVPLRCTSFLTPVLNIDCCFARAGKLTAAVAGV